MAFFSGLTTSHAVRIGSVYQFGGLLCNNLLKTRPELSELKEKISKVLLALYPLTSGAIVSAATGLVLPFTVTVLMSVQGLSIALSRNLDEQTVEPLIWVAVGAHFINIIATVMLFFIQPSLYHGACLGLYVASRFLTSSTS